MALKVTVPLLIHQDDAELVWQVDKNAIVVTDAIVEVAVDDIALFVGDTVGVYRAVEILNAFRWLYNGVQDRNLLASGWGGILYSGASIDQLTEGNRRTIATIGTFNDDDVFIGIGTNIGLIDKGGTVMIKNGFDMLIDHAREIALAA